MEPSNIRFSQHNIAPTFTNGNSIHDVIDGVMRNMISVEDFLPITVWFENGTWITENNRRLYMFRVLQYKGKIRVIEVEDRGSPLRYRPSTSKNGGVSISMRRGVIPYPHSIEEICSAERERMSSRALSYGANGNSSSGRTEQAQEGPDWGTTLLAGAGVALLGAVAVSLANSSRNSGGGDRNNRKQKQQSGKNEEECIIQ